jgi:hypothetical protein
MTDKTLTLKHSGNEQWDRLADLVNGEVGTVTGAFTTDGVLYHNAVFPTYGAELTWIPAEACVVEEVPIPSLSSPTGESTISA